MRLTRRSLLSDVPPDMTTEELARYIVGVVLNRPERKEAIKKVEEVLKEHEQRTKTVQKSH